MSSVISIDVDSEYLLANIKPEEMAELLAERFDADDMQKIIHDYDGIKDDIRFVNMVLTWSANIVTEYVQETTT